MTENLGQIPIAWRYKFNNGAETIIFSAEMADEISRYLEADEHETVIYAESELTRDELDLRAGKRKLRLPWRRRL